MLERLTIRNFRGIREGTLGGFGRVNILLGPNGCGKSTILESLYLCSFLAGNYKDLIERDRGSFLNTLRNERGALFQPSWHFGHDEKKEISLSLKIEGSPEFQLPESASQLEVYQGGGRFGEKVVRDIRKKWGEKAGRFLEGVFFATDLHRLKEIERVLGQKVLAPRLDKKIAGIFSEVYDLPIEGLSFSNDVLMALLPDQGLPMDSLGAGMRISLRLLMIILNMRDSILLLEEFDTFQHLASLKKLARILVEQAGKRNVQLILTTHNVESIEAFLEASLATGEKGFRLFPLRYKRDGQLESTPFGPEETENMISSGFDPRTLGKNE